MNTRFMATNSWHYKFMTISVLFLQTAGIVSAILTRWDTPVLVINAMLILSELLIFGSTGAFITSKIKATTDGIEHTSWFGLRHDFTRWIECVGDGLLMTPRVGYNLQFLCFSKDWRQKGMLPNGMIDWEYCGQLPQCDTHPKIGKNFCQIQYSDKVWQILKDDMPKEMVDEVEQQLSIYKLR